MTVEWLTAFIDLPADRFDPGAEFWQAVTETTRSPLRGEHLEFATLHPPTGDPHLRIQRIMEGEPHIHLDLHVGPDIEAVEAAGDRARGFGAHVVAAGPGHPGVITMSSPGGLIFCLVRTVDEATAPDPIATPAPNRLNQICIDVPSSRFDAEVAFWSALTGWEPQPGRLEEFVFLAKPAAQPMRLLVQRLGEPTGTVHAHLDLACGSAVDQVAAHHVELGAEIVAPFEYWTTMRDPAGMIYCLTSRDPDAAAERG